MYASKTTRGFYDTAIHGASMPEDVVEITAEEHAALLEGQSQGKLIDFDEAGYPFLADPVEPTRAEKEARAWGQIKAERDRRKSLGVQADGNWFHSDADSRIQQLALTIMGQTMPAGIQWKTMSDEFVLMTPTLAVQIFTATATLDQVLFSNATTHRTAMMAAAVPSEYDFSTGWPAFYQE